MINPVCDSVNYNSNALIYNKVACPIFEGANSVDMENSPVPDTQKTMLQKIQEVGFAITDLNLYLDTHPDCTQALDLFKNLASTLQSLKKDYMDKYGPLYAIDSADPQEFDWVKDGYKWPWEL